MYPPPAPSGACVMSNMHAASRERDYFKNGGTGFLISWFYSMVRNGGKWDYKQQGRSMRPWEISITAQPELLLVSRKNSC